MLAADAKSHHAQSLDAALEGLEHVRGLGEARPKVAMRARANHRPTVSQFAVAFFEEGERAPHVEETRDFIVVENQRHPGSASAGSISLSPLGLYVRLARPTTTLPTAVNTWP